MRVGETIWYAKKDDKPNQEVASYSRPKKIVTRWNYFTVMPASSRGLAKMMQFGEKVDSVWTAIANYQAFKDNFSIGDVFWIDGASPLNKDEPNAVIKGISSVQHCIEIILTENDS